MAWVSRKVYAILSQSEEGKDIIERLPDLTQDECSAELDRFFNSASGASSKDAFFEVRKIEQEDEDLYHRIGDEEVSERDYEDEEESSTQDVDARPNETKLLNMEIEEEKLQDMASRYLGEDKLKRFELIRPMSDNEIADMMRLKGLDEEVFEEDYEDEDNTEEEEKQYLDKTWRSQFEGRDNWIKNEQDYYDMNVDDNNYGWVQYGAKEEDKINVGYVRDGDHDHPVEQMFDDPQEAREFVEEGLKKEALNEMSKNFDKGEKKEDKMIKLYRLYDKAQSKEEKNEYLKQLNKFIEGE